MNKELVEQYANIIKNHPLLRWLDDYQNLEEKLEKIREPVIDIAPLDNLSGLNRESGKEKEFNLLYIINKDCLKPISEKQLGAAVPFLPKSPNKKYLKKMLKDNWMKEQLFNETELPYVILGLLTEYNYHEFDFYIKRTPIIINGGEWVVFSRQIEEDSSTYSKLKKFLFLGWEKKINKEEYYNNV